MNAIPELNQPLEIEISEAEILADLFYPAPPPSQALDARAGVSHRNGRHPGRRNGRVNIGRGRGSRRDPAAA
jgi:hypothetical protein